MTPANIWSISAEWIVPGLGRPIRNGVMRARGGRIEAIGPLSEVPPTRRHRDLGEVAVLPGLINAHTHLELTHLKNKLPRRRPMPQWLFAVARRLPTGSAQDASVADGAEQSVEAGTTALADICHNHRAHHVLKVKPLRKLCLAELVGIGPLARGAMARLHSRLKGLRATARLRFGIAPHAPYSTSEELFRQAGELARKRNWPVATHLAETDIERQFLLRGSGRFFEFLARLGMIDSSVNTHRCKPVEFARRVGLFEGPCILAHVNYIDDEEMKILTSSGASVVYCPRSSDFFGRKGHRYPEMLAAGINVALGTDSLASNDSLSVLDEMRRVRRDARVGNDAILRMATLNGAAALGWDEQIGNLAPGKQADWIALELPRETHDPLETILTSPAEVRETVIAGKTVFRR